MIKSLLDEADDRNGRTEEINIERKEAAIDSATTFDKDFEARFAEIESLPESKAEANEPENLSEISELADDELIFSEKPVAMPAKTFAEPFDFSTLQFNPREGSFAETTNSELPAELTTTESFADEMPTVNEPLAGFPVEEADYELPSDEAITVERSNFELPAEIPRSAEMVEPSIAITGGEAVNYGTPGEIKVEKEPVANSGLLFQPPAEPESFAETARNSGLAYAAAITLVGAVVFMMLLGWFADLLLGSSPLGVVGGIILGALIGFFQFFRLTAQIFKRDK